MNAFLLLLLLFSFVFTILTKTSFSQPPQTLYPNCDSTFSCGHITNVTYPFIGGSRPPHCGLKDYFSLTCIENTTTFLTQNSTTYRVLQLDQSQKTIVLSRSDLYDATCPSQFLNTTLNSTLFNYMNPQNEVLNLFYGCNTTAMIMKPTNLFKCSFAGSGFSDAYHLVGPVPRDPILRIISCSVSISVPLLGAVGDQLTNSSLTLADALKDGFVANYSVPHERLCLDCVTLGGLCGFDSVSDSFVCVCGDDRPCRFFSLTPPRDDTSNATEPVEVQNLPGKKSNSGMRIGLFVGGAALACIVLGWLVFYCRQKRKRSFFAKYSDSIIKEVPSPQSRKPIPIPPSDSLTKGIPSCPSLNSDITNKVASYYGVQVFTNTELEEATNNFDPCKELGDGGFGTVYYGVLTDGRVVAVKRLYENNFKRVEQFMNEVKILYSLRHQNLVKLHGCTSKKSRELLLVYEFVPNGTVGDHLHGKRAKSRLLSWPIRLNIAVETADALTYLHKSGIIHRDVKTNNLLLDNDFHVKVADFGLSRLFPKDFTHVSTAPQGTPGYVDPEYYQCYQLTEKSDVYSFGVVLIELISSLQAVDTNRHRQDINLSNMAVSKIQNGELHKIVDGTIGFETDSSVRRMVSLVAELAFRCLQQEGDMRPSMEEVFEVLRGIKNDDLNARNNDKVEVVDMLLGDEDGYQDSAKGSVEPPSPDSS